MAIGDADRRLLRMVTGRCDWKEGGEGGEEEVA